MRESVKKNEIRYDRQLRLWGDKGQKDLEAARVCLLNASITGVEVLKSLVLPGIGSFTIVDHKVVTEADVFSNFFVSRDQLGRHLAECVCACLRELNTDVVGKFLVKPVTDLVENDEEKSFLDNFDLIIGTDLDEKSYLDIGNYLYENKKPFVICKTYGLMGYVRVVTAEHHVLDAHPDFKAPGFQLDRPFPALKAYSDKIQLEALNHERHSHVPYLIVLLKALDKWRQLETNVGKHFPTNYQDKKKLKEVILSMRMPDEKGNKDEENFHEASIAVAAAVVASEIPSNVKQLLADSRVGSIGDADDRDEKKKHFWLLCRALQKFVYEQNDSALPLRGDLPDMISDSDSYVKLQNLYYERAEEQARQIYKIVCSEIASHREATINNEHNDKIHYKNDKTSVHEGPTFEQTRAFCKNAAFISVLDSRPLSCEYDPNNVCDAFDRPTVSASCVGLPNVCQTLADAGNNESVEKRALDLYIVWRACERFNAEKNRYPGTNGVPESLDKLDLKSRIKNLSNFYKLPSGYAVDDNLIEEMCRYGASEIHSVASIIGGLAAQEAIKLITQQYIPLNNTFIFDGNMSAGAVFEF